MLARTAGFVSRLFGRSFRFWFLGGLDVELELGRNTVVQLKRHFMFTGRLDGMLKHEQVSVDIPAKLLLQTLRQIVRGNRAERFAGFTGMEDKSDLEFADSTGQIFGFVQFARFALGAFCFQHVDLAHGSRCDFVSLAGRQKEVARVTAADSNDVRLGAKAGNVFGQNNLS
jgi:hypothetical protein